MKEPKRLLSGLSYCLPQLKCLHHRNEWEGAHVPCIFPYLYFSKMTHSFHHVVYMFKRVQLAQSVFIARKQNPFCLGSQLGPDSEQLKIINLLQIQLLNASEEEKERGISSL